MEVRNYVTPKILKSLERINRDCIRMHVPTPPIIFVECKVEPVDGGEPILVHKEKCNSWNRIYYNYMFCQGAGVECNILGNTFGAGYLAGKATSGTVYSTATICYLSSIIGGSGILYYGIALGTGNTAESFEDYVLATPIANGTGAGQMSYAAMTAQVPSYNAGTKKWTSTLVRVINNNSAGAISVAETAIYAYVQYNSVHTHMIDRTVLASPVNVPAAYKITVTYTIEMTFPA